MTTRRSKASAQGNIAFTMLASAVALGVALAAGRYVTMGTGARQAAASEAAARLINDMVTARIAQAISSTAILCANGKCYWNESLDDISPDTFGVSSVNHDGDLMKLSMNACLPTFTNNEVSLENCTRGEARAELRFMDIQKLQEAKVISGARAADDTDNFGIVATVKSDYVGGGGETREFGSSAVIRRPRPFVRIETKEAVCSPTCQVSIGTKTQDFCLSTPRIVNKGASSMAKVSFVVHNDGPGHLYRFKIMRSFTPNPTFNANQVSEAPKLVVDSENEAFADINGKNGTNLGLAPGQSKEFFDESLPCYDDDVFVREVFRHTSHSVSTVHANVGNHAFDGGAVWGQSVSTSQTSSTAVKQSSVSPRPSGTANYFFQAKSVEPQNALAIVGHTSGVAGSMTTTTETVNIYTHVTTVILVNTGMN